jgi:hypothetical protein
VLLALLRLPLPLLRLPHLRLRSKEIEYGKERN